jgi:hypothetical protein
MERRKSLSFQLGYGDSVELWEQRAAFQWTQKMWKDPLRKACRTNLTKGFQFWKTTDEIELNRWALYGHVSRPWLGSDGVAADMPVWNDPFSC